MLCVAVKPLLLSVIMPNVVILSVVAQQETLTEGQGSLGLGIFLERRIE